MALIKCEECGREVSDQAERCPHCGHKMPMSEYAVKEINAWAWDIGGTVLQVIGAFLFFPAMFSILKNEGSYYYRYSGELESDIAFAAFGAILAFIGLLVGIYGARKRKKAKEDYEASMREEANKKDDTAQV